MFYRPENGHGLPHNPFSAIVAPRPVGWISTRNADGVDNLAPYSFFNAVAYSPPQVMFASTSAKPDQDDTKDTVAAARESGVFCVNVVAFAARDAMNASAAALGRDVDEFAHADVEKAECTVIECPRVASAPASLECKVAQIVRLAGDTNFVVFGEVVGVHLRDDCLSEGRFDVHKFTSVGRMGYMDYVRITETFEMPRP